LMLQIFQYKSGINLSKEKLKKRNDDG